jgi:hypothetical protein
VIFVECFPDTVLVTLLGQPRSEVKHVRGKGRVVSSAWENEGSLGLVDEDPGIPQPRRLREFSVRRSIGSVQLREHPHTRSILVVLSPKLEGWLIKAATDAGLRMKDFRLPDNLSDLHAELSSSRIRKVRSKLHPFLEALRERRSTHLADLHKALARS